MLAHDKIEPHYMIRTYAPKGAVALALISTSMCFGQAPGTLVKESGLRVHAVAKRIASPAGAQPALHWVADPFPSPTDILVTNPTLAQRML
jgi:hypothetical protein